MVKHERLFDPKMPIGLRDMRRRHLVKRLNEAIETCDDRDVSDLLKGVSYYVACMHNDADRMEAKAEQIMGAAETLAENLNAGVAHLRCRRAAAERNALD